MTTLTVLVVLAVLLLARHAAAAADGEAKRWNEAKRGDESVDAMRAVLEVQQAKLFNNETAPADYYE
jgi:hypothetical protein